MATTLRQQQRFVYGRHARSHHFNHSFLSDGSKATFEALSPEHIQNTIAEKPDSLLANIYRQVIGILSPLPGSTESSIRLPQGVHPTAQYWLRD